MEGGGSPRPEAIVAAAATTTPSEQESVIADAVDGEKSGPVQESGSSTLCSSEDYGGQDGSGGDGGDDGGSGGKQEGASASLQQPEKGQRQRRPPSAGSGGDSRSPRATPGVDGSPPPPAEEQREEDRVPDQEPAGELLEGGDGASVAERQSVGRPRVLPPQRQGQAVRDSSGGDHDIGGVGWATGEVEREVREGDTTRHGGEGDGAVDDDGAAEGAVGDSGAGLVEGEEKREIGWAPDTWNKFSPMPGPGAPPPPPAGSGAAEHAAAEGGSSGLSLPAPAPPVLAADTSRAQHRRSTSLTRYPSLPSLSAGPYLSHKRGSSLGSSLTSSFRNELQLEERQREDSKAASTPRAGARPGGRGTPARGRKTAAPLLGMLQNAQDLASAAAASGDGYLHHHRSSSSLVEGAGDAAGPAAEGTSASTRRASRSMSVGFAGVNGAAGFRGRAAAAPSRRVRPLLSPLSITRPDNFDHEVAAPLVGREGGPAGGEGGWGGVGLRMRDKASSFMHRLPGPKILMQGERARQ